MSSASTSELRFASRAADFRQVLRELIDFDGDEPACSIYLPVRPSPDGSRKARIRFKNCVAALETELQALGSGQRETRRLLEPLLEFRERRELWQGPGEGRAVFISPGRLHVVRLPLRPAELVVAADRFHLKPLFAALETALDDFFLLALSQKHVRLFRGDDERLSEIPLEGRAPRSLTEVTGAEPAGASLQHHAGRAGSRDAIWHGHGAGKDDADAELLRFLRAVDTAMQPIWRSGEANPPVLLAGVADLLANYRQVSDYPELLRAELHGNVERETPDRLHERARSVLLAEAAERREATLEDLRNGDAGKRVSADLTENLRYATEGRIAEVFVAGDTLRWGRHEPDKQHIEQHDGKARAGDVDLLDCLAVECHRRGAAVHVLPAEKLPGDSLTLARLRY